MAWEVLNPWTHGEDHLEAEEWIEMDQGVSEEVAAVAVVADLEDLEEEVDQIAE